MKEPQDLIVASPGNTGSYMLVPASEPQSEPGTTDLFANALRIARKRKATIILAAFFGVLAAIAYVLPQPPVYQSAASIEVQTPNDDFLFSRDVNPNANSGAMFPDYDMATQVRILSTKSLLDRVVAKLNADENVHVRVPEDRFVAWRKEPRQA